MVCRESGHGGQGSKFLANDSDIEQGSIFKAFDPDGDGVLDKSEAVRFIEKYCKYKRMQTSPEFIQDLFERLDEDGDGMISWQELVRKDQELSMETGTESELAGDSVPPAPEIEVNLHHTNFVQ